MRQVTEDNLTDAVLARLEAVEDPRFKQIMTSLIRHLHAFASEVQLTEEEWFEGIKFLTATGQKCDDKRQEFILLSDILGLSMVSSRSITCRSARPRSTVLGPFFVHGAKEFELRRDLSEDATMQGEDLGKRDACSRSTASRSPARPRHLAGEGRRHLRHAGPEGEFELRGR